MRVRMKVQVSGARDGLPWPRIGGIVDLPAREAVRLCDAGLAVPEPETAVETATPTSPAAEPEKRGPGRPRKR